MCKEYIDLLQSPDLHFSEVCKSVIKTSNKSLIAWFFENISDGCCVLHDELYKAIKNNDIDIISYIFDKKLYNPDFDQNSFWYPTNAAIDNN